jgi:hypothetical protein
MLLTTVVASGAEETHEAPVDPIAIGLLAFAILAVLIVAVLMFGKGRPHS